MGGLLGGSSSPTPATYSYGGNPAAYIPTAQPSADTSYQSLAGFGSGAGGGLGAAASQVPSNNPSYNAYTASQGLYGQGQNAAQQYILGNAGAANQATNSAYNAADYYANQFFPGYAGVPGNLNTAASGALSLQPTLQANATNPLYASLTGQAASNPYYAQTLQGAQTGAGYGAGAAAGAYPGAQSLYNQVPGLIGSGLQTQQKLSDLGSQAAAYGVQAASPAGYLQNLAQQLQQQIAGSANPLQGLSASITNAGFDPQSHLYNQLSQQTMDASQAANAAAGIGASPYGASVAGNNQANFNINWQNQQLGRETQAASSADAVQQAIASILAQSGATAAGLDTAAGGLLNTGISGLNTAGGLYQGAQNADILGTQAAGNAYTSGLGIGQGATNLAASSAGLPSSAYTSNLSNVLPFLSAQSGAGQQGATSLAELLSGAGGGYTTGANIGSGLSTGLASTGALPYSTGSGIGTNQLNTVSGLQSLLGGQASLGQGAFALPQQVLNDLQSYLGLGQSAQSGALQGGAQGFNQVASGIGGAIGGANALFNPNYGLFGGGGGGGGGIGSGLLVPGTDTSVGTGINSFTTDVGSSIGGGGGVGSFLSNIPILGSILSVFGG